MLRADEIIRVMNFREWIVNANLKDMKIPKMSSADNFEVIKKRRRANIMDTLNKNFP